MSRLSRFPLRCFPVLLVLFFLSVLGAESSVTEAPVAVSGGFQPVGTEESPAITTPALTVAVSPAAVVRLQATEIAAAWSAAQAEPSPAEVVSVHLPFPAGNDAPWEHRVAEGVHHWRLIIEGPGATFLRPHFTVFPEKADQPVLAYPAGRPEQARRVARTRTAVTRDFWGPLIPGARLVLELLSPAAERPALTIDRISVGMASPLGETKESWCYLDPTCYAAWDERKTAIGRLYTELPSKGIICTGNLLMDAEQTYRPWLLTANHCVDGEIPADGTSVIWQYYTATCNGDAPDWSQLPTSSGADYRAGDYEVDYTLLLLDEPPPTGTAYLGWDRSGDIPAGTLTALHHPAGTYMRISFAEYAGDADIFWQVLYTESSTEAGSSGCPLIDAENKVIGTLSGGTASCGAMNEIDYYTKFSRAWDYGLEAPLTSAAADDDDDSADDDDASPIDDDDDSAGDDDTTDDDLTDDDSGGDDDNGPGPLDDDDDDDSSDTLNDSRSEDDSGGLCG